MKFRLTLQPDSCKESRHTTFSSIKDRELKKKDLNICNKTLRMRAERKQEQLNQ